MSIYTIPSATPFMPALARYLTAQDTPLQDWKIYLPNRRACRALRDAFLRLSDGRATLLPHMHPLGEEEETLAITTAIFDQGQAIPPAITAQERDLVMAQLILKHRDTLSLDQALTLATRLSALIDRAWMEHFNTADLDQLVQDESLAKHWQITLTFLKTVVQQAWPHYLQSQNKIDPGLHRRLTVEQLTSALPQTTGPVLLAGSLAPYPHIMAFLDAVAQRDHGVVILPGLNPEADLDDDIHITEGHPGYLLTQITDHLGVAPSSIPLLPHTQITPRDDFLSQWMRPAPTTPKWRDHPISPDMLDNITLCACADREEEALAIAIALRETLETPGKTASLITPDRMLAARVCRIMQRWGVTLDDSGGEPLTATPIGAWAFATLDTVMEPDAAALRLSALQSALAAGGADWPQDQQGGFRNFTRQLDIAMRGCAAVTIPDTLRAGYNHITQLFTMLPTHPRPLSQWVHDHVTLMEALATPHHPSNNAQPLQTGAQRLWQGPAGEGLAQTMRELMEQSALLGDITGADYRALLAHHAMRISVRPPYGTHPRLHVLGLIESRFNTADRVILGGLNDGVWPAQEQPDPFLSRPMRQDAGLNSPERAITLSAHDFVQCFAADEVIMTRAMKIDGAPTIPARWLSRLETWILASGMTEDDVTRKGQTLKHHAAHYDQMQGAQPYQRPQPTPAPEEFPEFIRITDVEILAKDPYSFYAKNILKLRPLRDIDALPGAAEKGTLIHAVMEEWANTHHGPTLPDQAESDLSEIASQYFTAPHHPDLVPALWWPRFRDNIPKIIDKDRSHRQDITDIKTECDGKSQLTHRVTLVGKADRVDLRADGQCALIDYKTGGIPSLADIKAGRAAQLTLEAAMITQGDFPDIGPRPVSDITYWHLRGGTGKAEHRSLNDAIDALAMDAMKGLQAMVAYYTTGNRAFISCPHGTDYTPHATQDYMHLSRILEWGSNQESEAA